MPSERRVCADHRAVDVGIDRLYRRASDGERADGAKAGELRLAGISSIAAANAWLPGFIDARAANKAIRSGAMPTLPRLERAAAASCRCRRCSDLRAQPGQRLDQAIGRHARCAHHSKGRAGLPREVRGEGRGISLTAETAAHPKSWLTLFVRNSTTYGQTLDSQLDQLRAAGCSSRNIYREKVTGAHSDRRQLLRMLGKLAACRTGSDGALWFTNSGILDPVKIGRITRLWVHKGDDRRNAPQRARQLSTVRQTGTGSGSRYCGGVSVAPTPPCDRRR